MSLHITQKQYLLGEMFSKDALRLARAIHNTYIEDEKDLYMEIRVETLTSLFDIASDEDGIHYLTNLFEEINEPISVENFKFYGEEYELRFMKFCKYKIKEDIVKIELSEEFLLAEKEYMIDKFLTH